jgi:hypothetical protein
MECRTQFSFFMSSIHEIGLCIYYHGYFPWVITSASAWKLGVVSRRVGHRCHAPYVGGTVIATVERLGKRRGRRLPARTDIERTIRVCKVTWLAAYRERERKIILSKVDE